MPDALRLIIDRLRTEQKVRPPVRLCDRISAAADSRAWQNRSLASRPCLMAVDSRECQPGTLDVSPSNPRRINRLKVSVPPRYLENPVSSDCYFLGSD
jgi:hypothetical protein